MIVSIISVGYLRMTPFEGLKKRSFLGVIRSAKHSGR